MSNTTELNARVSIVEIGVQSTIFIFAVIGNVGVISILLLCHKKLNRVQYFIVNLCIADLLVGIFSVMPQLIMFASDGFHGGNVVCKFVKWSQMFPLYLSSYMLVMVAIDRYLAICYPLSSIARHPYRLRAMVYTAWCLSIIFALPQTVFFEFRLMTNDVTNNSSMYTIKTTTNGYTSYEYPNTSTVGYTFSTNTSPVRTQTTGCRHTFSDSPGHSITAYVMFVTTVLYTLPSLILIFLYGRICYTVWGVSRIGIRVNVSTKTRTLSGESASRCRFSRAKLKTVRMTVIVVILFIVCLSPFCISQWVWLFSDSEPHPWLRIFVALPALNSCVNPWIYLSFSYATLFRRGRRQPTLSLRGQMYRLSTDRKRLNNGTLPSSEYHELKRVHGSTTNQHSSSDKNYDKNSDKNRENGSDSDYRSTLSTPTYRWYKPRLKSYTMSTSL